MKFFQKSRKENDAGTEHTADTPEKLENGDPQKAIDGITSAIVEVVAEKDYVTGWKLWSMLAALVLIFFLVLLDMSIVATVSRVVVSRGIEVLMGPAGHTQNYLPLSLVARCWMVWKRVFVGQVSTEPSLPMHSPLTKHQLRASAADRQNLYPL
jgi:hypothetical protein